VRRSLRFLVGVLVGGCVLGGYLYWVGAEAVVSRAAAITPLVLGVVVALVVLEGLADAIGVWASIAPLGEGVSRGQSVQFALAGDFFDILSPAGPVSSEPIMARFISVSTGTGYADALGVRSTAKYVKSGAQVAVSGLVGLYVLFGDPAVAPLLVTLGLSMAGLAAVGGAILLLRTRISRGVVAGLTPVVTGLSGLLPIEPYDRSFVASAVERYWSRVLGFRDRPDLLLLIVVGGILEQVLTAAALWVAIAGVDSPVSFLPILVVVPLPQVASVVPIPGSLGAYDLLLGGALVLVTGTPAAAATAAVLVVRTVTIPFGGIVGGICAVHLRGWRPVGSA
jgi:uncharacterized membrane protein YbhN (UPF0104 family)